MKCIQSFIVCIIIIGVLFHKCLFCSALCIYKENILIKISFTLQDFVKLINFSQLWSLHLADVSIRGSRLIFKLNQQQTHYRVIKSILNEEANYGVNFTVPQVSFFYCTVII